MGCRFEPCLRSHVDAKTNSVNRKVDRADAKNAGIASRRSFFVRREAGALMADRGLSLDIVGRGDRAVNSGANQRVRRGTGWLTACLLPANREFVPNTEGR